MILSHAGIIMNNEFVRETRTKVLNICREGGKEISFEDQLFRSSRLTGIIFRTLVVRTQTKTTGRSFTSCKCFL
jgi:hypothetical protein